MALMGSPMLNKCPHGGCSGGGWGGFGGQAAEWRSERQPLSAVADPANLLARINAVADLQPSYLEATAQPPDRVPVSKRLPHLWQSASRQYKETGAYPDPSPLPQDSRLRPAESPAEAEHRWAEDDRACEREEAAAQLPGGTPFGTAVHTPWTAHQQQQQHKQDGYLPEVTLGRQDGSPELQLYSGGPEPPLAMTPVGWPGMWGGGRPGSAAAGRRAVAAVALQLGGPPVPRLAPPSTLGDDLNEVAALLNGLTA